MNNFPLYNKLLANRIAAELTKEPVPWIEPDFVDAAVDKDRLNAESGAGDIRYMMGIDFGVRNDGAAISIIHRDKETNMVVVDYCIVYYPKDSDIWHNSQYPGASRLFKKDESITMYKFADEIANLCKSFNIAKGWFDQFNGYGLLDFLKERGLEQFQVRATNAKSNLKAYTKLKELLQNGRIRLPDNHSLTKELKSLKIYGEDSDVEAPRLAGYHDDLSDSLVRAVWLLYDFSGKSTKKSNHTDEHYSRRSTGNSDSRTKTYTENKADYNDTKYDTDLK